MKFTDLRKKIGSQSDMANLLGIAPQTVSDWERGRTLPKIKLLKKIAALCDVTLEELVDSFK